MLSTFNDGPLIELSQVRDMLEVRIFAVVNRVPLHTAIHNLKLIVLISRAFHLMKGQILKKRICSLRSKFFLLIVDLVLKGLHCQGKQAESPKSFPL